MIKNGRPYCDQCHGELIAWTRDQAEDNGFCGWDDWKTAHKHYCQTCYEAMFGQWAKAIGFPACHECETFPCKRGRDCWDNRDLPLHICPYETFYGELVGSTYPINDDFETEEPLAQEILHAQKMQQASHNKDQTKLEVFFAT